MNKKKLSVVMAGAMLASSVAPVLAAEVQKSEVSANELGLLQEELRTLVDSKVYSNVKENNPKPGTLADLRKKSVYVVYINGKEQTQLVAGAAQSVWQGVFNNLDSGDKIEVYSDGFKEVDGKVYGYEVKTETPKYTKVDELRTLAESFYKSNKTDIAAKYEALVSSAKFDERTEKVTITFTKDTGMEGDTNNSIVIGLGDNKIDVSKFINADGDEEAFRPWVSGQTFNPVTPGEFYGFAELPAAAGATDIKSELVREISITPGGYDLTVDELYDGLMLTEKGHDFFNQIKEAQSIGRTVTIKGNNVDVTDAITEANVANAIKSVNGKSRFSITFGEKGKLAAETYTITGTNEANAERLAKWMVKPLARVDILAGSNRYETAVEIAKEYAGLTGDNTTVTTDGKANIVLVNGNSLVDGLAAAPLASYLGKDLTSHRVPVLLTEADALPKATKAYLKEVLKKVQIGSLDKVTIHLVGGKTVLSKSLENELRGLGFTVERHGGDNREETSLAVADAMGTKSEAFLVGAEGEADAMSIAAIAAEQKTPIIVAKKGGVSSDATYELRNKEVTIIGGENAVSEEDYNAVKAEAKGVLRIAGSNRQATNAEIIKKYYKGNFLEAENVIVAKDGQRNKAELVDALAAANMAAEKNAPIVLATDKLSKDQLNALILNAKDAEALYQVGHGVARDVVKTIATQLGLTNR